jgi:two-component system response regulator PilR (NtrC family)
MSRARLLVADDEPGMRDFLGILLRKEGYAVTLAATGKEARELASGGNFDLLISDIRMPDLSGIDLLREVRSVSPTTLVVLITAYASTQTAVAALKLGASDYLTKPFDVDELRIVVRNVLERKKLTEENQSLRRELQSRKSFDAVVGTSVAMARILDVVSRVADTPATILLSGERGTGKEIIARAIHNASRRRDAKFVSVNCAAIQESLLESELFGHARGAFTGADSAHRGLFETASEGTILLDEIGETSVSMQAKLLRVLQERAVRRVGSSDEVAVDVRVIAATNRDLAARVAEGAFRADLFDRLNVISIRVPPLRERREDMPALLEHFLRAASREMGRSVSGVEPDALAALERYHWPGNVRELENLVRRAVALESRPTVHLESLPDEVIGGGAARDAALALPSPGAGFDMEDHLDGLRKRYIAEALARSGGTMVEAAKLLGVSFRALRYYAKKYGLR